MHTDIPTGEAVHIVAGYLGTDAADPVAFGIAARWVDAVGDAFSHRPDLDGQLDDEDRARLLSWLDDNGRDALLTVALDPATRLDPDSGDVVTHADPIHAAGATVTVQRMTDEADYYVEHVLADLSDDPLTANGARDLAAALLAAADSIDGKDSEIAIAPATLAGRTR